MANIRHVEVLRQGVGVWNQWRNENRDERTDLSKVDLSGPRPDGGFGLVLGDFNPIKYDLRISVSLSRGNFVYTNLSEADLSASDLSEALLESANLTGAFLRRANLREADLTGANLSEAVLSSADLTDAKLFGATLCQSDLSSAKLNRAYIGGKANLREANLRSADLSEAFLVHANLAGADLSIANLSRVRANRANFQEAHFFRANLRGANLSRANLRGANLSRADLSGSILTEADLHGAIFHETRFNAADLTGAHLENSIAIKTDFGGANLAGCHIYGISAWDVNLEGAIQSNLIITEAEPHVRVDDMELAQFIYLLLNHRKLRNVLTTLGEKVVLILGRFTERKELLNGIAEKVRSLGFLPVIFDFERPSNRDVTETVKILAGLSRFVIADITNPRSVPLELQATVPDYMVPFVTILQRGQPAFGMFDDLPGKYHWALPLLEYNTSESLLSTFEQKIVVPALEKAEEVRRQKALPAIRRSAED